MPSFHHFPPTLAPAWPGLAASRPPDHPRSMWGVLQRLGELHPCSPNSLPKSVVPNRGTHRAVHCPGLCTFDAFLAGEKWTRSRSERRSKSKTGGCLRPMGSKRAHFDHKVAKSAKYSSRTPLISVISASYACASALRTTHLAEICHLSPLHGSWRFKPPGG